MAPRALLRFGLIGTAVAALCCFTPVLVLLFGVIGLSALTGYLDYVLIPAFVGFVVLTLYALWRQRREPARNPARNKET